MLETRDLLVGGEVPVADQLDAGAGFAGAGFASRGAGAVEALARLFGS